MVVVVEVALAGQDVSLELGLRIGGPVMGGVGREGGAQGRDEGRRRK